MICDITHFKLFVFFLHVTQNELIIKNEHATRPNEMWYDIIQGANFMG